MKTYNLNFRPASYWAEPRRKQLANIKGEQRKQFVLQQIRDGNDETIDQPLLEESLPSDAKAFLGQVHPLYMGGEYLPDYATGEVEIARVSLQSTTGDVISVRARPKGRFIGYRIVDEYGTRFKFRPRRSEEPLTFGELIGLMDGVEHPGREGTGLTNFFRDALTSMKAEDPFQLVSFVRVSSLFYPDLECWYEDEAREWFIRTLREQKRFIIFNEEEGRKWFAKETLSGCLRKT